MTFPVYSELQGALSFACIPVASLQTLAPFTALFEQPIQSNNNFTRIARMTGETGGFIMHVMLCCMFGADGGQ